MTPPLFSETRNIAVRAMVVGERIDVRAFGSSDRIAAAPLLVRAGANRAAAVLRYGVIVLFNMAVEDESAFLDAVRPYVSEPYAEPDTERVTIAVAPGGEGTVNADGSIALAAASIERLQIVATVLAKSVVLGFYERQLAAAFDRIEPLAASLKRTGTIGAQGREMLREIGDVLLMQQRTVGRVEVAEKPDMLWDHPELERLYARLQDEYELTERARAVERKLDLISRTATTALDILQTRHLLRVEWYIVALILVSILLTLYDMFWASS
jgi:uncharacterized Rmd1/YagE family protein